MAADDAAALDPCALFSEFVARHCSKTPTEIFEESSQLLADYYAAADQPDLAANSAPSASSTNGEVIDDDGFILVQAKTRKSKKSASIDTLKARQTAKSFAPLFSAAPSSNLKHRASNGGDSLQSLTLKQEAMFDAKKNTKLYTKSDLFMKNAKKRQLQELQEGFTQDRAKVANLKHQSQKQ